MSPVNRLSVLAFASTALAVPHIGYGHGHVHGHQHLHGAHLTGSEAPFPYPTANGTGLWGTTGNGASTASSSSPALPETATEHTTQYQTVYQTISVNQAYPSNAVSAAGDEGEQCGVSTVTSTEKVYVTVTGGQAPSSSADVSPVGGSSGSPKSTVHITSTYHAPAGYGSSSSEAAPASSSAPAGSAPGYSAPASSSSEASPETTSEASAPAYSAPVSSAPSSSSEEAPISISISVPKYSSSSAAAVSTAYSSVGDKGAEGAAATATSSAPASYSSSSSSGSGSGKRGLAYNDASLVDCFSGSDKVSWAYNWESDAKGLSGFTYIPTLWGNSATYCDSWESNANSAISSGSTHLFSFNEPDLPAQANLSPEAAVEAYKQHMNPFKGKAQLCAPAVTNGGGDMGLTWLQNFLDACGDDCHIDCLNIHWYDAASNTAYFKKHIQQAIDMGKGKPVFVSEMGATGSSDEISSFLQEVMPWMDSNDSVAGYAYYMVSDGLLVTGSEPSTYGNTYKTYSS